MTHASARACAVLAALSPLGASASERVETAASVTIVQSAAVTVVGNAPLQTLLLTAAVAPAGVVFTAPGSGPAAVGSSGAGQTGGGAPGNGPAGAAAAVAGSAPPATDAAALPALVTVGGALGGLTIDGDAVSVSVGAASGGSAPGSARVSVVIAQFN